MRKQLGRVGNLVVVGLVRGVVDVLLLLIAGQECSSRSLVGASLRRDFPEPIHDIAWQARAHRMIT